IVALRNTGPTPKSGNIISFLWQLRAFTGVRASFAVVRARAAGADLVTLDPALVFPTQSGWPTIIAGATDVLLTWSLGRDLVYRDLVGHPVLEGPRVARQV